MTVIERGHLIMRLFPFRMINKYVFKIDFGVQELS